jgi:hypothetical protein
LIVKCQFIKIAASIAVITRTFQSNFRYFVFEAMEEIKYMRIISIVHTSGQLFVKEIRAPVKRG